MKKLLEIIQLFTIRALVKIVVCLDCQSSSPILLCEPSDVFFFYISWYPKKHAKAIEASKQRIDNRHKRIDNDPLTVALPSPLSLISAPILTSLTSIAREVNE